MDCTGCDSQIEPERLEALPATKICSRCARNINIPRPHGILCFDGKTGGTLQIVSKDNFTDYRRHNPYGRNTGRGSGIHRVTKTTSSM